jgi:hypothetical protein
VSRSDGVYKEGKLRQQELGRSVSPVASSHQMVQSWKVISSFRRRPLTTCTAGWRLLAAPTARLELRCKFCNSSLHGVVARASLAAAK